MTEWAVEWTIGQVVEAVVDGQSELQFHSLKSPKYFIH